jgi:aerobic carbon-monoxide dehydrogenase medium subunit
MKPPPFDYERPVDINGALASLASYGGRAKVLAGGQSLLAMLNLRLLSPERLIDVSRLDELKYIRMVGNELRIGALTTHNTVLKSQDVAMYCPIMVEAYRHVSHHVVRNRGTIGGSLCHHDPAAEMPLVVNLLGASIVARSRNGERVIAADQFFRGNFETALEDNELLTEIRVPIPADGHGWSFQEVSQRKGDFGGRRRDADLKGRHLPQCPARLPQRRRDHIPTEGGRSADRGASPGPTVVLQRGEGGHEGCRAALRSACRRRLSP